MAALGNVLLAWFNACLSWKVVWQSDSDLLDGSDGGVLLHQTRGTDPAVINDCATSLWRRKRPSKQIHPWLSSHLTHSLINTASSFNQYLLCRLIVAKKSLQGKGKKKTHTHTMGPCEGQRSCRGIFFMKHWLCISAEDELWWLDTGDILASYIISHSSPFQAFARYKVPS